MSERIPEGWEAPKLGQVFKLLRGSIVPQDNPTEKLEYYSIPVFDQCGSFSVVMGSEIESNKTLISEPAILVSKLNPRKPRVQVVENKGNFRQCASTEFMAYAPKSEGLDLSFFKYYFLSEEFSNRLQLVATGSTNSHVRVTPSETLAWNVPAPPLPEQQKIAAILSSVDEVIETTRAQIDKLKDLKTGMMQELLTQGIGHTEFKDSPVGRIPARWEVVELGKVLTGIDSGWSPNCHDRRPGTGEWGVLKVSSVTRGEFLEDEAKLLPKNLSVREKLLVHKGDILLTRANGVAALVGKCVIVNKEPQAKLMMSDKILRLRPSDKISKEFLLHVFNSYSTRKQIELCWGGSSGQKNISQSDIKDFYIPLPSIGEQIAIAKTITQASQVLYDKNNKLAKLISAKKALMQDLLTGKVRVQVDAPETAEA